MQHKHTATITLKHSELIRLGANLHVGHQVAIDLRRKRAPVLPSLVPLLNPKVVYSGSITYNFKADNSLEVTASWTLLSEVDDDDEL